MCCNTHRFSIENIRQQAQEMVYQKALREPSAFRATYAITWAPAPVKAPAETEKEVVAV